MGSLSTSRVAGTRLIDLVCWRTASAGGIFEIMPPFSLILSFMVHGDQSCQLKSDVGDS